MYKLESNELNTSWKKSQSLLTGKNRALVAGIKRRVLGTDYGKHSNIREPAFPKRMQDLMRRQFDSFRKSQLESPAVREARLGKARMKQRLQ